ncbi:manganese efflux pump MntP [Pseudogemmobacter sonorensis]|uniref:manganese efflux pump MntP n=1 Tax=Pseudogemmobacter sonorensis TaxID=2989681 RepID=UPI0036A72CB7
MSPVAIGVLAISMSVDAFIAALGQGVGRRRPGFGFAMRTGFVFGAIEMLTPLIGWLLGTAASVYVQIFDHWIAFALLVGVGGRMVLQALNPPVDEDGMRPRATGWALIATAFGTSIDAMAVGVSLAFFEINIIVVSLAIGLATMMMSTAGVLAGGLVGLRFGRWAEGVGGIALAGLGLMILVEHLGHP